MKQRSCFIRYKSEKTNYNKKGIKKGEIIMKKKNTLLIAFTILGLTFIGCQSETAKEPVQQETINESTQASGNNQMEAAAPKSDDVDTSSTTTSDATTVEATIAQNSSITEAANVDTAQNTNSTSSNILTEDEAKQIALKDAGIHEKDVTNIRVKKDIEDGRAVYEVEFYVQNEEYDYEIDVNTGKIISKDYEIEDDFHNQETSTSVSVISQEDAIKIVLKRVPGATEQNVRIKLDVDDGHSIYEGEVYYKQTEYEFELNAENGKILEWSEDRDDD